MRLKKLQKVISVEEPILIRACNADGEVVQEFDFESIPVSDIDKILNSRVTSVYSVFDKEAFLKERDEFQCTYTVIEVEY